jgi:hypothetical protein
MSLTLVASAPEWIGAIATAIGVPVAAVALIVGANQLRGQRQTSEAQFLLSLDEAFRHHDTTHRKFRPPAAPGRTGVVGRWSGDDANGPSSAEDWADVEAYMGLFERVELMISSRLVDFQVVKRLYGYRVGNVLSNPIVVQGKLVEATDGWLDFIALAARLGYLKAIDETDNLEDGLVLAARVRQASIPCMVVPAGKIPAGVQPKRVLPGYAVTVPTRRADEASQLLDG